MAPPARRLPLKGENREGQTLACRIQSMMASVATYSPPAGCPNCNFSHCFCRWRRLCSPEIPRVGSGGDYAFIQDDDNVGNSTFSVVVGVVSKFDDDSSLRLHRFRVAQSGRVLGRSGDALEVLAGDVDYKPKNTWSHIRASNATRSPDGRSLSLCLFSREHHLSDLTKAQCPRPLQLHLDFADAAGDGTRVTVSVSPLPGLNLGPLMPTCPISAAGELWAPHLTGLDGPCSLLMRRLDKDAGLWVEVAGLRLPRGREGAGWREGNTPALQGFAVVGSIILLSFYPYHLFFTFDCSSHAWAPVITFKNQRTQYFPLQQCSVYVEEDDNIYFLCGGSIYAYKLCWDQDRHQHWMAPPAMVGSVCPSVLDGNGFLTHLGGRVMCSVWIGEKLRCNCDSKLVLITSFRVMGDGLEDFIPKEVDVLQSTCRRLELWPSDHSDGSYFELRFLQEYEEFSHEYATPSTKKERRKARRSAKKMKEKLERGTCKAVTLTPACCREEYMDGCTMIDDLHEWHFISRSNCMYVASHERSPIYAYIMGSSAGMHSKIRVRLICRVGNNIIGLSDNLQNVYYMNSKGEWMEQQTQGFPYFQREWTKLSGYVVLSDESFMVSDAETNCCYLLELHNNKWSIVTPYSVYLSAHLEDKRKRLPRDWPGCAFLSERSVYVKGFIYSCSNGGLAAYELIEEGDSYYLGDKIDLQFSWHMYWERERMCLDYVGEDTISGAIMFCVVQDDRVRRPDYPDSLQPICITTVQVKTEGLGNGKLKPKTISHVSNSRSSIDWDCSHARNIITDRPLNKSDVPALPKRRIIRIQGCFAES
ncbi:unnamed protein product [Urochloa decumbens]|uniref:Uncharacterized protein n=1 Tax=Urochloa decumbens TaxID=240449 RepID=A0ABC9GZ29_9POAL